MNEMDEYVFPVTIRNYFNDGTFERKTHCPGITLRDYFAAKALSGALAVGAEEIIDEEKFAGWCYRMADAMLAARVKKTEEMK
jgi:hypothetical protein